MPQAEKMENWLLTGLYDSYIKLIAKGARSNQAKVREWINGGPYSAEKAKAAGLIDAVEHRQAFEAMLKSKYGNDVVFDHKYGKKKPPTIGFFRRRLPCSRSWASSWVRARKAKTGEGAVGIVYVDGPIVLGGSQDSPFAGSHRPKLGNPQGIRQSLGAIK